MIYASVDIETSGLNPERHQILEIACILDDTSKLLDSAPHFHAYIMWDEIVGEPVALRMNADLIAKLSEIRLQTSTISDGNEEASIVLTDLGTLFRQWLVMNGVDDSKPVIMAGKTFARFDWRFLERVPNWPQMHKRVLDPTMLFLRSDDRVPPATDMCYVRAGLDIVKGHNAMEDALGVCQLIRAGLENK